MKGSGKSVGVLFGIVAASWLLLGATVALGQRPEVPTGRGPYDTGMPDERGYERPGPQAQQNAPASVVADPNAIREKVASFAGLADALAALEAKSRTEQRGWQQRRLDNRTSILRAADAQFVEELALVRTTATQENATRTVRAIDDLGAVRKQRHDVIADVLREERRAAILAEREASRAARGGAMGSGRGRGRGMQATETTTAAPAEAYRTPITRDPNAPPLDPNTEAQLQAWQSSAEDKRSALGVVTESDLRELESLRQLAEAENAKRTAATIEGLMLARQQRQEAIVERIVAAEERERRLEERANARSGRGAERGATQHETTPTRGRRLR
ncbi:MAG: hypothetical protein JW993_10680 [Sedimentisphaerales bacterium]|nr:hypothetical protein [Sedimentisphaerales bacterium]